MPLDYILRYPLNKAHFCQRQAEAREKNGHFASALEFREVAFQNLKCALTLTSNDVVQNSIKLQISHEEKLIAQLSACVERQKMAIDSMIQRKIKLQDGALHYESSKPEICINLLGVNNLIKIGDTPAITSNNDLRPAWDIACTSQKSSTPRPPSQEKTSDALEPDEDCDIGDNISSKQEKRSLVKNSSFDLQRVESLCATPTPSFEELAPLDCPPLDFLAREAIQELPDF